MKLPYSAPKTDDETIDLAGKIVRVLVDSGVTYEKADAALTTAQEMLMFCTKPVVAPQFEKKDSD